MTAEEHLLKNIACLLERGAMPRSACGSALLKKLSSLLHAGVIVEERAGAGRRLVVRNMAALEEFSRRHFPVLVASTGQSSRAAGVARFRDSKVFTSDTPEILSVRAWASEALLREGQPTEAVSATAQYGVFSFHFSGSGRYALYGPCALVENPAVFAQFERLGLAVGLVMYGQGRASHRLLDWLATMSAPDFGLIHLPDYDPAGLIEFRRLRARLGDRVRLHIPPDLDRRFTRFSNRSLLDKPNSRAMLASLRGSTQPEIRRVLALIDSHNAGLEQEALLL